MPRQFPNTSNSPECLTEAVEAAADMSEIWRLLRQWRKKDDLAMRTIARHTPHWDEPLVWMIAANPWTAQAAVENPSWPAWATECMMDRAIQALASEQAKSPIENAALVVRFLSRKGLIDGTSATVGEMIHGLAGRSKRMPYRQLKAAQAVLEIDNIQPGWFEYIAECLHNQEVMEMAMNDHDARATMKLALEYPLATEIWVRRWIGTSRAAMTLVEGSAPKWGRLVEQMRQENLPQARAVAR